MIFLHCIVNRTLLGCLILLSLKKNCNPSQNICLAVSVLWVLCSLKKINSLWQPPSRVLKWARYAVFMFKLAGYSSRYHYWLSFEGRCQSVNVKSFPLTFAEIYPWPFAGVLTRCLESLEQSDANNVDTTRTSLALREVSRVTLPYPFPVTPHHLPMNPLQVLCLYCYDCFIPKSIPIKVLLKQ